MNTSYKWQIGSEYSGKDYQTVNGALISAKRLLSNQEDANVVVWETLDNGDPNVWAPPTAAAWKRGWKWNTQMT